MVVVVVELEDYSDLIEFQVHEATQFITQQQLEAPNEHQQTEALDSKIPYAQYLKTLANIPSVAYVAQSNR